MKFHIFATLLRRNARRPQVVHCGGRTKPLSTSAKEASAEALAEFEALKKRLKEIK